MAAAAGAQCYEFTGPGVTLDIDVATISLQLGPTFLDGGYTTTYNFSGDNSLTVGGTKLTSKSVFDGSGNIQFLAGVGGGLGATTFELVVPSEKPAGAGEHSWVAMIASNQNLIPKGLLPAVLPPISEWTLAGASNVIGSNYDYIEVQDGSTKTRYPITGLGTCSTSSLGRLATDHHRSCECFGLWRLRERDAGRLDRDLRIEPVARHTGLGSHGLPGKRGAHQTGRRFREH